MACDCTLQIMDKYYSQGQGLDLMDQVVLYNP